jgi:hypothetical protein
VKKKKKKKKKKRMHFRESIFTSETKMRQEVQLG